MEHLPARDADAIRVSLEMVDKADIYIGLYAWRYGHRPEGHDISITEMEFDQAVKRRIPIHCFYDSQRPPADYRNGRGGQRGAGKTQATEGAGEPSSGTIGVQVSRRMRSHIIQSLRALLKEEEAASQ